MYDLHSHILPELDDGSQSLRESLAMAQMAVESGVRAIVATPHCSFDRRQEVKTAYQLLIRALEETGIPLKLYLGMEIWGSEDTSRLLRDGNLYTLNGSNYPLIEFSFDFSGEEATQILQDVIQAGYRPLVAHPERYSFIRYIPEYVNEWQQMGCLFQLNRGSLLGRFGEEIQEMAFALVDRGFATVVASDAHSPRMRTPWMQDVYQLLTHEFSPAAAHCLLQRNPRSIINNESLMPVTPEWF